MTIKFVNGIAFPAEDKVISARIGPNGEYQFEALEAGLAYVRKWRVAIDAGAHVGLWTRVLAAKFRQVIAFEPSPDTYEALLLNLAGTIDCRNQALGALPGKVHMVLDPKYEGHTGARYIAEGGDIERVTMDSLGLPRLDFLKLDLEGGETDALLGGLSTLARCHPVIVIEDKRFGKRFGYDREVPAKILAGLGAKEVGKAGINKIWSW